MIVRVLDLGGLCAHNLFHINLFRRCWLPCLSVDVELVIDRCYRFHVFVLFLGTKRRGIGQSARLGVGTFRQLLLPLLSDICGLWSEFFHMFRGFGPTSAQCFRPAFTSCQKQNHLDERTRSDPQNAPSTRCSFHHSGQREEAEEKHQKQCQ